MATRKATFGAGCFWGVEAAFMKVPGVISTRVGYMGGKMENPTYRDVCTDTTGHAEVVEVTFDDTRVHFDHLLEIFWSNHDPTTLNAQGPDVGTQYRSVVFFHDEEQRESVHASMAALEDFGRFDAPIVTQIVPAGTFWEAEEYHQQYLEKRGLAHCAVPPVRQ